MRFFQIGFTIKKVQQNKATAVKIKEIKVTHFKWEKFNNGKW